MKFLHTMIKVANIEKSLKFYQEVLGLKIFKTMKFGDEASLYFLGDEEGDAQVELAHYSVMPEGGYTVGTSFGHLAFGTDNMDEFSQKLKENGFSYSREPFLINGKGPKVAFVDDPDGHCIEIIEKQ